MPSAEDRVARLAQEPTLSSIWRAGSGRPTSDELLDWPPDLFAMTGVLLERSEAYRFGLTPFGAEQWQERRPAGWADAVERAGREWSAAVEEGRRAIPDVMARAWRSLRECDDLPLDRLAEGSDCQACDAVLTLHAIADEACSGLGIALDALDETGSRYRARCRELLARTGSLARVPSTFLRVLPKERTPASGTSSRSLSRYVCLLGPGVDVQRFKFPCRRWGTGPRADHINFLLLPWPLRVRETDFRPLEESVHRMAREPYGLFEFAPAERLDLDLVERVLLAAQDEVDSVDVVFLPESAVDETEIVGLEALLDRYGVIALMAGVRQRSRQPGRLSGNWVHIGVNPRLVKGAPLLGASATEWFHVRQNKHHRWSLDERQITQYHLGGALHPRVRWSEATEVPRKSLGVLEFGEGLTVVGVVCEDLAQIDQVAEIVRSIGPSAVYAPLLDGPQLNSRWAARYASVLADDPGSSVLTLTSFGMAQRSRPGSRAPSPIVALCKDPLRETREIALESGAEGVLMTMCLEQTMRRTSDGRWPVENSPLTYNVALYQVRSGRAASGPRPPEPSVAPGSLASPELGVRELTILTSWAEAIAEALSCPPDRADRNDRIDATLAEARAGAPWRAALGLREPEPKLAEAIDSVVREVRAALSSGAPSLDAVLTALRDGQRGEPKLDALARRVLCSMLSARGDCSGKRRPESDAVPTRRAR